MRPKIPSMSGENSFDGNLHVVQCTPTHVRAGMGVRINRCTLLQETTQRQAGACESKPCAAHQSEEEDSGQDSGKQLIACSLAAAWEAVVMASAMMSWSFTESGARNAPVCLCRPRQLLSWMLWPEQLKRPLSSLPTRAS